MSTIYIVEDHATVRDALALALVSKGHQYVGGSDNPTQALADILRLAPNIAILDLQLGARSGHELLAELQQRRCPTRLIVLSMAAHKRDVALAIRHGAQGYVLKGWPIQDLLDAIESVQNGHRHFTREVGDIAIAALQEGTTAEGLESLSVRERQVVTMVVMGRSSSEIGAALHLSPKTVDSYRSRLMRKLKVQDVPSLVRLAVRDGLIALEDGLP